MPTAQQLTQILNTALQKLWVNECDLFTDGMKEERSVHERNIVAYLFHYLQAQNRSKRKKWDVEYNRQNGTESKIVFNNRGEPRLIVPDVILHERNSGNNYCVIEVKYSVNTNVEDEYQKDYNSLIDIIRTHNYQYAISLIISPTDAHLTWFTKTKYMTYPQTYISQGGLALSNKTIETFYPSDHMFIYYDESLPRYAQQFLSSNN